MLVVIAWIVISGIFGPLFGKLTSVQENNNSSFLPKGAEATQAAEVIATFSDQDSFTFPTLILRLSSLFPFFTDVQPNSKKRMMAFCDEPRLGTFPWNIGL